MSAKDFQLTACKRCEGTGTAHRIIMVGNTVVNDDEPCSKCAETGYFNEGQFIVVCQYCREVYKVKDGLGASGISHGICRDCWRGLLALTEEYPDDNDDRNTRK